VCLVKDTPIEIDLTLSFLKHITSILYNYNIYIYIYIYTEEDLYIADLDDIDPELSKSL